MIHLPELITDLALILMLAGLVTIVFKGLKQPVVLGYIVAGMLVGPSVPFMPTVEDVSSVKIWAEIGVIFLLFGLGLEFSFRKLARVGAPATITGFAEVLIMLSLGYGAGKMLGWSNMDSLFLGGILSISSTTIIIRALEELKMKRRGFANLVFGVLIVEDLVAILLLVLLTTVGATNTFQGGELLLSVGKLSFFLVLWFVAGIFLVPSLLRRVRVHMTEETTVIVSIGFCLMMVYLTTKAGFSPALGAFIMGSIFAETPEAERIEHVTRPVKDLFAAVFFVSVGMLIEPKVLVDYAGPILLISLITIVGKVFSTSVGALLSGRSLRHSVQAGFSLAQIGEFSFIIATLGLTLKVTSDFLYPIAVAVSAITTFTTPYFIRLADPACDWLERRLPENWKAALGRYQASFQRVSGHAEGRELLKTYGLRLVLNGVLVTAIFLLAGRFLEPIVQEMVSGVGLGVAWGHAVTALIAIAVCAPFLWAMALGGATQKELRELWAVKSNRSSLLVIEVVRVLSTIVLLSILVGRLTNAIIGFVVTFAAVAALGLLYSKYLGAAYAWFERRFLANLTAREDDPGRPSLAPWDAHLVELIVEPNSAAIGRTLMDLKVRESFGVTIALVERGRKRITAPGRHESLLPGDKVSVIGTDEQIQAFAKLIQEEQSEAHTLGSDYALQRVVLPATSTYTGHTIRDSGLRERVGGLVVGIERDGRRYLNPDSMMILKPGDVLWIVGDPGLLREIRA